MMMEKKINLVEILRDCPKGMELDSPMFDNLYFDKVVEEYKYPIGCYTIYDGCRTSVNFTEFGELNNYGTAKCVIFPKGKTTWEGFYRPFKDGDVVFSGFDLISIYKEPIGGESWRLHSHVSLRNSSVLEIDKDDWTLENIRFATEEERAKLFQAIKDHGYKWNAETKTLEELVESKFDITTLKPFESRVLVRDEDWEIWRVSFWGCLLEKREEYRYDTTRGAYAQCVPYEGNEHILGTTEKCDDYYKNWE